MPGIPRLPGKGEAVVEPSALQASPQADAAAAAAAATPAVAAAPYVTSKMEVEAAENGRPIPKLCCPTCGVTRELELIEQPTGAPKIRYISGPTYVSTGRRGGDFVQKCNCKKCGHFYLTPLPNDDAAATTAASASAGAAAAAPAAPAAETELWMQVQLAAAAAPAVETELPIEAEFSSKQPGEPYSEIFHHLPRVGAPHSGHTCHRHRFHRSPHRADPGRCPLPQVANSSCIVQFQATR
jgi:hypothetical protein